MTIDTVVKKVERISDGGNLLANLKLLEDINTWQTSQEVFKAWREGAAVQGVSTANMGIYRLDNGEVVFNLLSRPGNLFMDERFLQGAYDGISSNNSFFPTVDMKKHVMAAITAGQSATIHYPKLRVKTKDCGSHYGYVKFGDNNTDEEKRLFHAVYGDDPDTGKRVYLLRENTIREQLGAARKDMIVRACYLDDNQDFIAIDRGIGNYNGAVRGVRRESVAAGDAKKLDSVIMAYGTVLDAVDKLSNQQVIGLYVALHLRIISMARLP